MGISGVNLQDRCVQENEGPTPILDRTRENLCSGDRTTVKARRMLIGAAKALRERGTIPPGARDATVYRVEPVRKSCLTVSTGVEELRKDITVAAPA